MKIDSRCVPCILNQMLRVCRFLGLDRERSQEILRRSLRIAADTDFRGLSAPQFSGGLYAEAARTSGVADPYGEEKRRQNQLILDRLDFFQKRIRRSRDPLRSAALYALLGNVIDLGGEREFDFRSVFSSVARRRPGVDEFEAFRDRLERAGTLLYIGDNAGEAVLDRLFIAELRRRHPRLAVAFAVRSAPAINDVLAADARHAGVETAAEIVESGSAFAGVVPALADPEFRRRYREADLVIAKGQGNFETLEEEDREIFFVFQVKCPVVSGHLGLPEGTLIFSTRRGIMKAGGEPT